MRTSKAINLIAWQDEVGNELKDIIHTAIGKHVKRSRAALFGRSKKFLIKRGWDANTASRLVKDAFDMAELEMLSENNEAI